jgi:tetratricopeptide (TPR) repeat protein
MMLDLDEGSLPQRPGDVSSPDTKTEIDLAMKAEAAADYAAAVDHWRAAIRGRPTDGHLILKLVGALHRGGRTAEAETASADGLRRFPDQWILALEYGWLAGRQNRWPEAVSRWQTALEQFPNQPRLHAALGAGLTALQRFPEAEAYLAAAVARFESNPQVATDYALLAARQGHWAEAAQRWQRVAELSPEDAQAVAQRGHCLRLAGQPAEARAALAQAEAHLPPHPSVAIERAILEEPDWTAAIPLWQRVIDRFPDNVRGYLGLAQALVQSGSPDQAEPVLQEAVTRFPNDKRVVHDFAHLATDRRDWDAALTRWERLRVLEPDSATARHRLGEARWGTTLDTLLEAPPTIERFQRNARADDDGVLTETDIIMQFESLGENCEFGLVQRYFNAEPLGLLRFAATSQAMLLEALRAGFEGVGDPAYTTLTANPGEYITGDRRYGMVSHTFINPRSVAADALFPKQCKRLSYLRRKLLDDLAAAEKTFVVLASADATDDAAREIHAAMRAYGPARLLFVRARVAGCEPGSLRVAEAGLMFGYLDRYGHGGAGAGWNISNAVWLDLCRNAYAAVQSGRC